MKDKYTEMFESMLDKSEQISERKLDNDEKKMIDSFIKEIVSLEKTRKTQEKEYEKKVREADALEKNFITQTNKFKKEAKAKVMQMVKKVKSSASTPKVANEMSTELEQLAWFYADDPLDDLEELKAYLKEIKRITIW